MFDSEVHILPRPVKPDPLFAVSWVFPNTYEIGMSSLGYQLVWWLLEQDAEIRVERAFMDRHEFARSKPQHCELVGFTLSWELDGTNVVRFLKAHGINPIASARGADEPVVFGGGPVLAANPEPFAEFFDVVLLGDAETTVPALISAWKRVRVRPGRQVRLLELAAVPGVYVPSLYRYVLSREGGPIESIEPACDGAPERVTKQIFMPPWDYVAHSQVLTPKTPFGNMFMIEIARSCPQECRFCLASYLTRPFRAANVGAIVDKVDLGLKYTPKIGLLGPSVTEHPDFDSLAEELLKRPQTQISIASIRADTISPLVLKMLVSLGQRSVTVALESGSERLRAIMKKNLSEEQVKAATDLIASSGIESLKLYGIVGLPDETQMDLDETIRLLADLKKAHRRLKLIFGVSSFVPKAQTPFQWAARDRACKIKLEYLRKHLARLGIEVRPESHNWSDIQTLLSRGDRRLTPVIQAVASGSADSLGAWRAALRNRPGSCPGENFYVFREIPYGETLPWSHLVEEARAAMLARSSQTADRLAQTPEVEAAAGRAAKLTSSS